MTQQTPHVATEATRRTVLICAASGVRQGDIAKALNLTAKTLRKHYRQELDSGAVTANAAVADTLYRQALDGNVTACIFWLKTRAGWSEKNQEAKESDALRPTKIVIQGVDPATNRKREYGFCE